MSSALAGPCCHPVEADGGRGAWRDRARSEPRGDVLDSGEQRLGDRNYASARGRARWESRAGCVAEPGSVVALHDADD
jgi:hypothetical protein